MRERTKEKNVQSTTFWFAASVSSGFYQDLDSVESRSKKQHPWGQSRFFFQNILVSDRLDFTEKSGLNPRLQAEVFNVLLIVASVFPSLPD